MKLQIPSDVHARLKAALQNAGSREIGGILMGEHVDESTFRVVDVTVQMEGGTVASFVREVEPLAAPLQQFFEETGHQYTRFNYLGEWHSHPSFSLIPSGTDHTTMRRILEDPESQVNFVVLLLIQLGKSGNLEQQVYVYQPHQHPFMGNCVIT